MTDGYLHPAFSVSHELAPVHARSYRYYELLFRSEDL
ncbi:hypothetical protein BVRB_2g028640 [Beta vulgaris subsp. vulgaris]|nr:hypothetical protein BVRB_2g028640 [Beta vulgaris subsp. vulgaris]